MRHCCEVIVHRCIYSKVTQLSTFTLPYKNLQTLISQAKNITIILLRLFKRENGMIKKSITNRFLVTLFEKDILECRYGHNFQFVKIRQNTEIGKKSLQKVFPNIAQIFDLF